MEIKLSVTLLALMAGILFFHCPPVTDALDDPMIQKSIIYDKKTPEVFYCPLAKHEGLDEMIVKARPLSKLCEHDGKTLPADYKSDCFQNVDESEFACKEKRRILKFLDPPGMEVLEKYKSLTREKRAEMYDLAFGKKVQARKN